MTTRRTTEASETIRRFYAAVDQKPYRRDALSPFFAPDFRDHNRPPAPPELADRDVILGMFDQLAVGLPDAIHQLLILEPIDDDRAMVYWRFVGTHSGAFFDRPASGKPVAIHGVDILRVEGGRFTEQWHVEELAALFAQTDAKSSA